MWIYPRTTQRWRKDCPIRITPDHSTPITFGSNIDTIKVKEIKEFEVEEFLVQGRIKNGEIKRRYDVFDRDPLVAWVTLLDDGEEMNDLLMIGLHLGKSRIAVPIRFSR